VFSLTTQAIQLGYCPRMKIEHTSPAEPGQIYVPQVNWILMLACVGLVVGFESSSHLAAAYGIAISLTMLMTTILFFFAARRLWGWSLWTAGLVCAHCNPCGQNSIRIVRFGECAIVSRS